MQRIFGNIPGVSVGDIFDSREALNGAGVHRPIQAGISGSQDEGADSIVLSGGYIDDEDYGDEIIYTGHGGRDTGTERQVEDQELSRGNKALAVSYEENLPIRVIRGYQNESLYSPELGYRYDGLYQVINYWSEKGKDGYLVWRYKLDRIDSEPLNINENTKGKIAKRITTISSRLLRNEEKVKYIKNLYQNKCQVCRLTINTPVGPYSEAAHIRPLGKPHNGTDHESNMLCLCPNHHKMLDYHVFSIHEDLRLEGIEEELYIHPDHDLDTENLNYHREHFYKNANGSES